MLEKYLKSLFSCITYNQSIILRLMALLAQDKETKDIINKAAESFEKSAKEVLNDSN